MALININSDVFDITNRIKEIDSGYFVVYNTNTRNFEIHNTKQNGSTFCITCDTGLNATVITKLRKSKIENIDKILREIDENNAKYEKESNRIIKDESAFKLKEMMRYANKRESDSDFSDSYITNWV